MGAHLCHHLAPDNTTHALSVDKQVMLHCSTMLPILNP
jgi:hypothetical protein